jgi:hypothetical protein
MGYAKYIDFSALSDADRKKLKNLLEKQKEELKQALSDANFSLASLEKATKKAKKSKKAKR